MAAYTRVFQGASDPSHANLNHHSKSWIAIDTGWSMLLDQFTSLVSSIKNGNEPVNVPAIKAYTMVFDLCQQGCMFGQEIYSRLEPMLATWLREDLLPRYRYGPALSQFQNLYHEFSFVEKYLSCVFNYLNQFHVIREQCLTIEQLCFSCFHRIVFSELRDGLTTAIHKEISVYRSNYTKMSPYDGDISLMKTILSCVLRFRMLPGNPKSIYDEFLSGPVIRETERFYGGSFANDLLSELGTSRYLSQVSSILKNELSFFRQWLLDESISSITERLHSNLLIKPFPVMLADEDVGFNTMFNKRAATDLSLVYSLYRGHPSSLDMLATLFQEHVVSKGKLLSREPSSFVSNAIALRISELQLIQTAFKNSIRFHRALHDAFELILETASNSAQLICNHLNNVLPGDEDAKQIENLVALVCCLRQEKDAFSIHFRCGLANRLLNSDADHKGDKDFVEQLRGLLGKGFTHQMDVMISDITRHPPLVTRCLNIQFSGRVLTTGSWPKSMADCEKGMLIPPEISSGLSALEELYKKATVGRRISWIHSAGNSVITALCLRSTPEIHLSSIQAVILLLFNQRDSVIIKDLPSLTGLSLPMIKRALRHMCTGKYNVLLKEPPQSYSTKDLLSVNYKFSSPERRIHINLGAEASIADNELRKSIASIKENRKHIIEAYIVKLMKAKKTLNLQELKSQVMEQKRQQFHLEDGMLTDIIMDLINREYLSRDPTHLDMIRYNPE